MERSSRSWMRELAVAALAVMVAFLLRAHVLDWVLLETGPYLMLLIAVIVAAHFGGWKSGLIATLLSTVVCAYFFLPKVNSFWLIDSSDVLRLPLFVATGVVVSLLTLRMHSSQRQAEASARALRAEQELWRNTLASIGDGIIATDVECRITFLNSVAEALTGWSCREAQGKCLDEILELSDEETSATRENPARQALAGAKLTASAGGTILLSRDGRQQAVEYVAAPIAHEAGPGAAGAVLVIRDITRRRRAERELHEMDRRKDEFLATLAHELRSPLAVIHSAVDLMSVGGEAGGMEEIRPMIQRQVQQLVRLIDDLLDVSRISRGMLTLKKQPVDLRTPVAAAVEVVQPMLARFEHELTVELGPQPLLVDADAARINQIVANLLTNAAKYTPAGGHLRLTTDQRDGRAIVCVEDDGIGMAAEDLPRIFDMYAQVGQSLQRDEGSLGIGLTVVKRLVELHGGTITAYSGGVGRGSRFTISLPLCAKTAVAARSPAQPADVAAAASLRILVVEDHLDNAELFGRLLATLGHKVEVANTAHEALELVAQNPPEIVFCDIQLPDMDGKVLAGRLRRMSGMGDAYLVAVTGYATARDRHQAIDAGFDEHLVKPVTLAHLRTLLAGRCAMQNSSNA